MPETNTKPKAADAAKTAEYAAAVRDQMIDSMKQAQQFTLDAVTTWADVINKFALELPALPFVPARDELVEGFGAVFGMTEELLASQRKFASNLVNVLVTVS
jgi:hypothetical protein